MLAVLSSMVVCVHRISRVPRVKLVEAYGKMIKEITAAPYEPYSAFNTLFEPYRVLVVAIRFKAAQMTLPQIVCGTDAIAAAHAAVPFLNTSGWLYSSMLLIQVLGWSEAK